MAERTSLVPHPRPMGAGGGERPVLRAAGTAPRHRPDWALVAVPAITLAAMLWGLSASPYWGDEADTVSAVSRTLPQLWRLLGHVDAVHGLYYLLLWPVVRVLGVGEFATRLPSAVAMAAAALGVAVIARRLVSRRAGLFAGLVFAILPAVSLQGHNARPYAMVTAVAVLASYLLIRALLGAGGARWFAAYGLALALLGYLELFGLLLVPAHALALAGLARQAGPAQRRRLARRWLLAVAGAGCACAPVVVLGWHQRVQIAWITVPGWRDAGFLVGWMAAGSLVSAAVVAPLTVLGGLRGRSPALGPPAVGAGRRLAWLAVPWLVLPPLALVAASQLKPVYNFRYIVFCLPAVALLAGAGLAALGWAWRAAALSAIVALAAPAQLGMRGHPAGMRTASQLLSVRARPSDAVVYPGPGIPPWYLAYPSGLGRLRQLGMGESGPAAGRLYGTSVPLPVLKQRERGVCRIWALEVGPGWRNPAAYIGPGFRVAGAWQPAPSVRLWLYRQPGCQRPAGAR